MKSVVQALYRLTMAVGNIIDVFIMVIITPHRYGQKWEFLFFASLLLLDMCILALISRYYIYKEDRE